VNWNISAWSIRNPIITMVLFLVLTLAGFVSFGLLNIDENPNIDVPTVAITVTQVGAAPAELETQITKKVEDAVAGVGNVDHIRSTVNDGVSSTVVEFILGTNTDRAVNDVRDAVTKIRQNLPQDIQEPIISRVDFTGSAMMIYSVASASRTTEELSWFVDNEISRELLSVRGVSKVDRSGGVDREIRVNLDPSRLLALGITAEDVNRQVRALNINLPGGRGELGAQEQSIRTLGSAQTIEQLGDTEIILPNGRKARLRQLGQVEDGTSEPRQSARLDGQPVVSFAIERSVGSSEVATEKGIEEKIAELRKQFPDVKFTLILNRVKFVHESYEASIEALLLGAALAIVVIFIFLKDWRATLISGLAMPLSAIPTFAVMKALGYTLNNLSLLAFALVVGILVDDAIVEIENIVRHMKMGKSPFRAALDAADEIGLAVVATTMSIVAVFLPVGFMGGIPGQFFRQFGVTVAVAVLFSLLVARLVTPLMAAYFLKDHETTEESPWYVQRYNSILNWSLDHRLATVLIAVAVFAGSLALARFIPTGFITATDRGQSILTVELPPGAKLADTDQATQQISRLMKTRSEVESVFVSAGTASSQGTGGSTGSGKVTKATVYINLKPRSDRALSQQQFEQDVRPLLDQVPGARLSFFGGSVSGGKEVTVVLTGDDAASLTKTADALTTQMRGIPALVDVSNSASLLRAELLIKPKFDRAADQGVSVQQIAQTAKIATLGDIDANLAKFNLTDRQIPIRVQIDPKFRSDLDIIENLRVTGNNSKMVPLKSVAEFAVGSGAAQIDRYDRARKVSVEANLNGVPLGPVIKQVYALPALKNLPASVRIQNSGDAKVMADVFSQFGLALGAAVILIFAVLVLLFGSFFHPFTIMVALPLSLGGALAGLLVFGKPLGLYALIGIVMLMGLVTKNSILLVEYAIVAMREGTPRRKAMVEAGDKRMQPILMTTIAMIAGMMPIALGIGAGAEARSPMAVAVVGGLVTSTLLTLVVIPVVFTYVDDLQNWFSRTFRNVVNQPTPQPTSQQE
jgi:hydrophobic/amphiphilic exporter-1 (mainly G- bacteria), HAE1 family